ncbi:hypothetical protein D3C86_1736040 [compost metagenome]
MAGHQLGFQYFAAVEGVIHRLNTRVALEILEGGRTDVVVPVVHVHGGRISCRGRYPGRQAGADSEVQRRAVTTHNVALLACIRTMMFGRRQISDAGRSCLLPCRVTRKG